MVVWFAYNMNHYDTLRPNLFSSREKAEKWCEKDSERIYGSWNPDAYVIDLEAIL